VGDASAQVQADLDRLLERSLSLMLATADESGRPEASYAPFVRDEHGRFYVFVSELSRHTANLAAGRPVSVLIIEDEQASRQIFARLRVTYYCAAHSIERGSARWLELMDRFQQRFGEVMDLLRDLTDFTLFEIDPLEGQLIRGFGQAYRLVDGRFEPVRPSKD
jgi:hypothetical protein